MELNLERIEDRIVEDAVSTLIHEDRLSERVSDMVKARLDNLFNSRVTAQVEAAIQAAIDGGFDREYQKVDTWGKPAGEPTTLRKELDRQVSAYWQGKVNGEGRPDSSYSAKYTRAEYIMLKMMERDLKENLNQMVVNIAGTAKDVVRSALHQTVNQMLSTAFSVNSADDQEMKKTGLTAPQPKA